MPTDLETFCSLDAMGGRSIPFECLREEPAGRLDKGREGLCVAIHSRGASPNTRTTNLARAIVL